MDANQLYSELVTAIDNACANQRFMEVCDAAQALGMTGGQTADRFTLSYKYDFADSSGQSVNLYIRSYDPSGPGQIEPDINRFTVRRSHNGREVDVYDRQYTD